MNIAEILLERARASGAGPAIIDRKNGQDRATTFHELERHAATAAAMLLRGGVSAGDAVLVFQPMSMELYAVLLAVFRMGALAMFLDPSAGRTHIEACCGLRPPKAFVGSGRALLLRMISPALRKIPIVFCTGRSLLPVESIFNATAQPHEEILSVQAGTPALLTFTSGSTAAPKPVVRTHGFLSAQHCVLERCLRLLPGQIDLTTLPIFGLANLASGAVTVIPDVDLRFPGAINPVPVMRQIVSTKASRVAASPAFLEKLVEHAEAGRVTLPLTSIFTGGAPVFPTLLRRLATVAPGAHIEAVYGSTEAEPIAHVALDAIASGDLDQMCSGAGLLAGAPIGEIDLRIIRDHWGKPLPAMSASEFASLEMKTPQPGEIVVTGEHVLKGYLDGRHEEETKFSVDGQVWHRTGDAGYLDESGRLWLLGRCVARPSGESGAIYPLAVEAAATECDWVHRAAFLEVDGRHVLMVETRKGRARGKLDSLRESLRWAQIDEIKIINRLPMDRRHNAKVDYVALRKRLR
jgi:olefin beta-lactone synthetase